MSSDGQLVPECAQRGAEEEMKELHARVGKVVDVSHSDADSTDADIRARAAATRIQAHYRGHVVRKSMRHYRIGGQLSEVCCCLLFSA